MRRRRLLRTAGAGLLAGSAGCVGGLAGGASRGTVELRVAGHDRWTAAFEACEVTVGAVALEPAEGSVHEVGLDGASLDLAATPPDAPRRVAAEPVPAGEYVAFGVAVTDAEGRLTDPSDGPPELRLPEEPLRVPERFRVTAGGTTALSTRVAPVPTGHPGEYELEPGWAADCGC